MQGSNGHTDIEKRLKDTKWGKEGQAEIYGESNMETYITTYKIDNQWEFAVFESENSNWGLVTT